MQSKIIKHINDTYQPCMSSQNYIIILKRHPDKLRKEEDYFHFESVIKKCHCVYLKSNFIQLLYCILCVNKIYS